MSYRLNVFEGRLCLERALEIRQQSGREKPREDGAGAPALSVVYMDVYGQRKSGKCKAGVVSSGFLFCDNSVADSVLRNSEKFIPPVLLVFLPELVRYDKRILLFLVKAADLEPGCFIRFLVINPNVDR